MVSICIIGVYFGKLPNYFDLWLKSCATNTTINFLLVTDNVINEIPANMKVVNMKLEQMKVLAESKLGFPIELSTPYKCCDYKPVYGLIFSSFLEDTDYWGHCDFDMLFGDIRYFVEKYNLSQYDKFLPLGHLALYRNTNECNIRYMIEPKGGNTYKYSFSVPQTTQFDELGGINSIYLECGFPFFRERVFADISWQWKRIKLAELYKDSNDVNYNFQVFYWQEGKVKRAFIDKNKNLHEEEFMYIHIKKRQFKDIDHNLLNASSFYIEPHCFVVRNTNEIIDSTIINTHNPYKGALFEFFERIVLNRLKNVIKAYSHD